MAKELLRQNRVAEAVELLDLGLERMPTSQVRFTDTNTYPFLEAYYAASAMGDKEARREGRRLLREYAQTLIEYIEHYLRFEGAQGDMVSGLIDEKLDQLGDIYYLASYADRKEVVAELNDYYRSLGVSEENLIDVGDKRQQPDSGAAARREITGTGNEITHVTLLLRALFLCCRPHPERISGRLKSGSAVKTDIF